MPRSEAICAGLLHIVEAEAAIVDVVGRLDAVGVKVEAKGTHAGCKERKEREEDERRIKKRIFPPSTYTAPSWLACPPRR